MLVAGCGQIPGEFHRLFTSPSRPWRRLLASWPGLLPVPCRLPAGRGKPGRLSLHSAYVLEED